MLYYFFLPYLKKTSNKVFPCVYFHRYNSETSELINDELGIAYPVIDGIPNMIPQDARLVQKDQEADVPQQ